MLRPDRQRSWPLAILLAVYVRNFMDRQIPAILKPAIKHDLGLADTQLGVLSGLAFTLFYTTLAVPLVHALALSRQRYSRAQLGASWIEPSIVPPVSFISAAPSHTPGCSH